MLQPKYPARWLVQSASKPLKCREMMWNALKNPVIHPWPVFLNSFLCAFQRDTTAQSRGNGEFMPLIPPSSRVKPLDSKVHLNTRFPKGAAWNACPPPPKKKKNTLYDTVLSISDLAQGEQFPEPQLDPSILKTKKRYTNNYCTAISPSICYVFSYHIYIYLNIQHYTNSNLHACAVNYKYHNYSKSQCVFEKWCHIYYIQYIYSITNN